MRNRPSGITLVEIVIVVLILGIMAAVAVPQFTRGRLQVQLDLAARRLISDLMTARSQALAAGANRTITFGPCDYTLTGMNNPDRPTDTYQVRLAEPPYQVTELQANFGGQNILTYNGYGVPLAAGQVVLKLGNNLTRTVKVDADTGFAAVASTP